MSIKTLPERKDIAKEDTWDLESIFPTVDNWENALKEVKDMLPEINKYQGTLGENPQALVKWIKASGEFAKKFMHVYMYAVLDYQVDTTNEDVIKRNGMAGSLSGEVGAAMSFATPEVMEIGFEKLAQWVKDEPDLAPYKHMFERLEILGEHVRSKEIEELLSMLSDPFSTASDTHGVLANADLKFKPAKSSSGEEYELTNSTSDKLLSSTDLDTRKSAWENYADAHLDYKNTMANALATGIKQDWFNARARNYKTSLEAALKPNFIPENVFHNLLDTFKANLPTWHRYWEIRKKALGVDKIHIYDARANLIENMPELSFDKAMDWINEGMAPLGEEYVSIMRKGVMEERWVDRYPNKGKRFGAFSWGYDGTRPFIMTNFDDDIFGLSTLAHELGHSMHSYYTKINQPPEYHDYGLFLAEVASNFNQAVVRAHLLETQTDKDMQIAIIEEAMANFHRYFFIMPTLARFELEVHESIERGEGLTAQGMIDLMADLFTEGFGPNVVVDRDRVGSTWMQFSTHLYSNFYVFQYATGISAAHALADKVLAGSDDAREKYLDFLKSGGSNLPIEILKTAGVDLSKPDAVEKTFAVLGSMVDKLETLVG